LHAVWGPVASQMDRSNPRRGRTTAAWRPDEAIAQVQPERRSLARPNEERLVLSYWYAPVLIIIFSAILCQWRSVFRGRRGKRALHAKGRGLPGWCAATMVVRAGAALCALQFSSISLRATGSVFSKALCRSVCSSRSGSAPPERESVAARASLASRQRVSLCRTYPLRVTCRDRYRAARGYLNPGGHHPGPGRLNPEIAACPLSRAWG
jgi:hypothetical protein